MAFVGYLAMCGSALLYLPQIKHMIDHETGSGVSYVFLVLSMTTNTLWVIYGHLQDEWPVIICNAIMLMLGTVMAALKWHYAHLYAELPGGDLGL